MMPRSRAWNGLGNIWDRMLKVPPIVVQLVSQAMNKLNYYQNLQVSLSCFVFAETLGPDALLPWREDSVRINSILDGLDETSIGVVIEVVKGSDTV